MQNLDRFKLKALYQNIIYDVYLYDIYKGWIDLIDNNIPYACKRVKIKECILLKCTGKRDNKDTMIYEGYEVLIEGKTYYIDWSDDNAGFVARIFNKENPQGRINPDDDIYGLYDCEMEIIGSIYADRELLKEK